MSLWLLLCRVAYKRLVVSLDVSPFSELGCTSPRAIMSCSNIISFPRRTLQMLMLTLMMPMMIRRWMMLLLIMMGCTSARAKLS